MAIKMPRTPKPRQISAASSTQSKTPKKPLPPPLSPPAHEKIISSFTRKTVYVTCVCSKWKERIDRDPGETDDQLLLRGNGEYLWHELHALRIDQLRGGGNHQAEMDAMMTSRVVSRVKLK